MRLPLPYPPSVNHYWQHNRNGVRVSDAGKAYKRLVAHRVKAEPDFVPFEAHNRLALHIDAYPPTGRKVKRDLDNLFKSVLDALADAGVYPNDEQIDHLSITRKRQVKGGQLVVFIDYLSKLKYSRSEVMQ